MTNQEQTNKKVIDINISFQHDPDAAQMDYDYWVSLRQLYIDKGFSEQQAKYFNRSWEQNINHLVNEDWYYLLIEVKANVLMPCQHIEEFYTNLGGYCYDWRTMDLDKEFPNEAIDLIEDIKDQIKQKIDINDIEFNIIVDKDIK